MPNVSVRRSLSAVLSASTYILENALVNNKCTIYQELIDAIYQELIDAIEVYRKYADKKAMMAADHEARKYALTHYGQYGRIKAWWLRSYTVNVDIHECDKILAFIHRFLLI